ncbi:MAG: hypothetical protein ACRD1E_13560, partial [Terriglobales bacterium]
FRAGFARRANGATPAQGLRSGASKPGATMTEAELEQHLHDLYRCEEPPGALGERILAHARERRAATVVPWRRRHAPLLSFCAALIAACAYLIFGAVHQRQVQAQRAREAQAHLAYALQITTDELNWTENKIMQDMNAGPKGANQ